MRGTAFYIYIGANRKEHVNEMKADNSSNWNKKEVNDYRVTVQKGKMKHVIAVVVAER